MYAGETPETMISQIRAVERELIKVRDRDGLAALLPGGGARCALDCALWDLEARRNRQPAWRTAGLYGVQSVHTAHTIGIRSLEDYEATASRLREYQTLKIKVAADAPLDAVRAVRRGAPNSRFIVDPNQAWSVDQLKALAPVLVDLGVVLLEQPIRVGDETRLDGYACPIALCADELINDGSDLALALSRFQVVNIKLDKTGGLTEALRLADQAAAMGFELMVGCMSGSSLSMAPAFILAQRCAYIDLDGPLLQSEDWPDGLSYQNGLIQPPKPDFWGG